MNLKNFQVLSIIEGFCDFRYYLMTLKVTLQHGILISKPLLQTQKSKFNVFLKSAFFYVANVVVSNNFLLVAAMILLALLAFVMYAG